MRIHCVEAWWAYTVDTVRHWRWKRNQDRFARRNRRVQRRSERALARAALEFRRVQQTPGLWPISSEKANEMAERLWKRIVGSGDYFLGAGGLLSVVDAMALIAFAGDWLFHGPMRPIYALLAIAIIGVNMAISYLLMRRRRLQARAELYVLQQYYWQLHHYYVHSDRLVVFDHVDKGLLTDINTLVSSGLFEGSADDPAYNAIGERLQKMAKRKAS